MAAPTMLSTSPDRGFWRLSFLRSRRTQMARNSPGLLALRLLIARRLLRGLKLLHGLLKAAHDAFECDNFRGSVVQLISGVERVLGHEPLQKIDVALKAPRSLVEPGGFRAVLFPAISCARPASTPTTIRLKPSTAILTMLLLSVPSRSRQVA